MTTTQEMLTVQVGPIRTSVQTAGSGDPLVYLHGAFGYKDWPSFLDKLAEQYTVMLHCTQDSWMLRESTRLTIFSDCSCTIKTCWTL